VLTEAQRAQTEVVLVGPRNPLNIGAVARAMANFGLQHLTVVAPWDPSWREARSAVGAPELLLEARQTDTLAEALAGSTLVAGTGTLTYRRAEQIALTLPQLPARVAPELARGGRFALVFGSEKHGLSREDLALCHLFVEIPTDPGQPSMNLGQAAAVCLYELAAHTGPAPEFHHQPPSPARAESLERLTELTAQVMEASGYSPSNMAPANHHDLRLLLRRLALGEKDARRLLGLFRRILYRLRPKL
jgi:tRNA/rRNA methyltransferase